MQESASGKIAHEDLQLRRYIPGDHEGVIDFLRNTFHVMGRDFSLGGKDEDIRAMDRVYGSRRGAFHVIERRGGGLCGCVGVREFSEKIGELKRLYLAEDCRGLGFGRALCAVAIEDARGLGYELLRLDTTIESPAALALFRSLDFHEIDRYNDTIFPGMIYMEKKLGAPGAVIS